MCSELFRIPVEWGGVPILGLGVLLAVWLVGFGALLAVRAVRHGVDGEFWGYAQPAAIGAAALYFAPMLAPQGVPIRGYGVMLLLAISTGVAMAVHRARRHGVDPDTIFALVFWLFVAGIAGARAFFVIEYWDERFADKPLSQTLIEVVQFTEGGLVVYGSVIGGLVAFVLFVRRRGLPMAGMADILAPCFMAGLAIGRIGCLLNGCCYGGPCELPWAVTFPQKSPPFEDQLVHGAFHGLEIVEGKDGFVHLIEEDGSRPRVDAINGEPLVSADGRPVVVQHYQVGDKVESRELTSMEKIAEGLSWAFSRGEPIELTLADGSAISAPAVQRARSLPVHPTQVYSAVNAGLTSWLLWNWFPFRRRDGEVALLMFTIYPVSRFLLEIIRTDESAVFGTELSISQNVSLIVLALAAVGWVVLLRTPPGRRLAEAPRTPSEGARTAPASAA